MINKGRKEAVLIFTYQSGSISSTQILSISIPRYSRIDSSSEHSSITPSILEYTSLMYSQGSLMLLT